MKMILILTITLILAGCATYHTTMVHDQKKETYVCEASGLGLFWVWRASVTHDECVARQQALGFHAVETKP
jgi:uncharacterized protein YceK